MKKIFLVLIIVLCSCMFYPHGKTVRAQKCEKDDPTCYQTLSPIQDPGATGDMQSGTVVHTNNFPAYLQSIYRIGIGMCFVLGVIMFTWAGIEYIVSESMSGKGDAKNKLIAAITGLGIALASYLLLNTINPDLIVIHNLNTEVNKTPANSASFTPPAGNMSYDH